MNRLENVEFVNAVLGEFPDWIDLVEQNRLGNLQPIYFALF